MFAIRAQFTSLLLRTMKKARWKLPSKITEKLYCLKDYINVKNKRSNYYSTS